MDDLQARVDEVLLRLPPPSRLGVRCLRVVPGELADKRLAADVEVSFEHGSSRTFSIRSHAWVDGYFDGKGHVEGCRSLLFPPDILALPGPTVIVERLTPDSIVRGVLCYLRHGGETA
jgi:hypothetical protein